MTVAMSVGNTRLVEYGIKQEESDIRAHVSAVGCCVYAFPTSEALKAIDNGAYRVVEATQQGIVTSKGYLVPPGDIKHMKTIDIPDMVMSALNLDNTGSTTEKGDKAVKVVKYLLRFGMFPLWLESEVIEDYDMQISGTDILVRMNTRIQVKHDGKAGDRQGCTGNLFIQIAECNPFRKY